MSDQQEYVYWNPEPGETVTGKLVKVIRLKSKFDNPDGSEKFYPLLILETSDGDVSVTAQASVLLNELEKRQPRLGEEISITYLGKKEPQTKGRLPYHAYRVLGGTDPNAWNWGSGDGRGVQQYKEQEPDVPIDTNDFEPLPGSEKAKLTGEKFGDDLPF